MSEKTREEADAAIVAAWNLPRPERGSEDYWEVAAARHEAIMNAYNDMIVCLPAGSGLWRALHDASIAQELAAKRAAESAEKRRDEWLQVHNPAHINRDGNRYGPDQCDWDVCVENREAVRGAGEFDEDFPLAGLVGEDEDGNATTY